MELSTVITFPRNSHKPIPKASQSANVKFGDT